MRELEVTKRQTALPARVSTDALLASFAEFLRLDVAQGDASPHTLRSYHTQARQFLAWCEREGLHPATAGEGDILAYRRHLVDAGYTRATVGLKLAVVRRLYEAARWRGLRLDNPAAGVKPPREHTAREERVKYLPLDGLRRLLAAPLGDSAQAQRDRAILALMGVHGLRVGEVAGLLVTDVDLEQGQATVKGKGQKVRTVYLTEATAGVLADWLAVRDAIASAGVDTLFVGTGHHGAGAALSTRGLRFLVDGYLERLLAGFPAGTVVLITADHGMHTVHEGDKLGNHGTLSGEDMFVPLWVVVIESNLGPGSGLLSAPTRRD